MSDRPFRLILIDPDEIFRLGLLTALESFPDLQVVAEAETAADALQLLARYSLAKNPIDLVILELGNIPSSVDRDRILTGLDLSQQLKDRYPKLPILLLSTPNSTQIAAARQAGIEGYCPKGNTVLEIVNAIRCCAAGQFYWVTEPIVTSNSLPRQLRQSGLRQINLALNQVTVQLQNINVSTLDRLILAGQRRELVAARWLVNHLLPIAPTAQISDSLDRSFLLTSSSALLTPKVPKTIFETTLDKLQLPLQNLTDFPLEIDILRPDIKQQLLVLILHKLQSTLDELSFSQIQPEAILQKRALIIRDLWQAAIADFFGKYYTIHIGDREVEVVNILIKDTEIVQKSFLDKIPLLPELISYLIFDENLGITKLADQSGIADEMVAELLLNNLLIQVANGVIQPLLNHLSDIEEIKYKFYHNELISSREVAKFRNNLSWKYRIKKYIEEPTEIFESRYNLFGLSEMGVKKISIYAPRINELEQLKGLPFAFTLILELRDAIAPRIKEAVSFIGSGVVYLLTQVIGRGIGLIGRGIIQGIGNSLQESRFNKNNQRQKSDIN